jgi:hypothetical protein
VDANRKNMGLTNWSGDKRDNWKERLSERRREGVKMRKRENEKVRKYTSETYKPSFQGSAWNVFASALLTFFTDLKK